MKTKDVAILGAIGIAGTIALYLKNKGVAGNGAGSGEGLASYFSSFVSSPITETMQLINKPKVSAAEMAEYQAYAIIAKQPQQALGPAHPAFTSSEQVDTYVMNQLSKIFGKTANIPTEFWQGGVGAKVKAGYGTQAEQVAVAVMNATPPGKTVGVYGFTQPYSQGGVPLSPATDAAISPSGAGESGVPAGMGEPAGGWQMPAGGWDVGLGVW